MKRIVLLSILLIAACNGTDSDLGDVDIFKGREGLVVEFMKDSPPDKITENQEFAIGMDMKNKGTSDIKEGYVSMIIEEDYLEPIGWEADVVPVTDTRGKFDLNGKTKYNPGGEKITAIYKVMSNTLEEQTETHTVFISVNACYTYQSQFSDTVCIDTNIFNTRDTDRACEVKDIISSGQGAPVGVTKVKTTMYTEGNTMNPKFIITIKNLQDGQVVVPDKADEMCTSLSVPDSDYNRVSISSQLSKQSLECSPNPVVLRKGEGITTCELKEAIDKTSGTYPALLSIQLDYGYTSMISDTIEIRSIPS